jgi:phage-related protein (TIGR01555 family)
MPTKAKAKTVMIGDAWQNAVTNMMIAGKDRRTLTSFDAGVELKEPLLDNLYRYNGLARRIVDLPAREMTRQWLEIEGDTDGIVLGELERLEAQARIKEMLTWTRAKGGAIGVMLAEDGSSDLALPLDEGRIKALAGINVFDRFRVQYTQSDLYKDPTNPKYLKPEFYTIQPLEGASFKVHETRCLRMDGLILPALLRSKNQGWGDSVLQAVYDELRALGEAYSGAEKMIAEFVQAVMSVEGLIQMLASTGGGARVKERLELLDLSLSMFNLCMVDAKGETYAKHSSSVGGVPELLDRFKERVSAVAGISQTLLFGVSPAGLNATGASDIRHDYDNFKAGQEETLTPVLRRLVYLIAISKSVPKAKPFAEAKILWKPLWQPTEREVADTRKVDADRAAALVTAGILMAEEVRQSFWGGEKYSGEIQLDDSLYDQEKQAQAEREMELLKNLANKQPEEKPSDEQE